MASAVVGLRVLPLRKWRARKEKGLVLEPERVLPMGCSEAIALRLWREGCSCSWHSYFQPWPIGRSASDELGLAAEEFGMLVTGRGQAGVSVLDTCSCCPSPRPVRSFSEVLLRPESCLPALGLGICRWRKHHGTEKRVLALMTSDPDSSSVQ